MSDSAALSAMVKETEGLPPPQPELLRDCPDAAVWPVLTYPHDEQLLRQSAVPVEQFDELLRNLAGSLAMTMYAAGAVGLAAPQVGWNLRVFVIDVLSGQPPQKGRPASQLLVAVNPTIWTLPSPSVRASEKCLSFPGGTAAVARPMQIAMKAYNLRGEAYALGCGYHLARVIQHEYDHLQGTLMVDRLDPVGARKLQRAMKLHKRRALH